MDTLINAVNNSFFSTWPGLTKELVSKHLGKSRATSKGHMNRERQGLHSTKKKIEPISTPTEKEPDDDYIPLDHATHTKEPDIICFLTSNQEVSDL